MERVKIRFDCDLVYYHDGFTRSEYVKGEEYEVDPDFAKLAYRAGWVEPQKDPERFEARETKPALMQKETKPVPKAKVKTKAKSKTSAKKPASKRVSVEEQSNNSTDN